MRITRRPSISLAAALTLAALVSPPASGASGASLPSPKPGTAAQVAALVKASSTIATLPKGLVPSLTQAPTDRANTTYPTSVTCLTLTACAFGDTTSDTVVVLYGDSHAQMWLPAIAPDATALKVRLVLVWNPACPVIDTTLVTPYCQSFRATTVAKIHALDPALVLLADRTSDVVAPDGKPISSAQWQLGMVATIRALKSATTRVAVIGDVTQFNEPVPTCLAQHPTKVRECAVPYANPSTQPHFVAEQNAATTTKVPYIATRGWLCTATCSAVVGPMVVYFDQGHVSSTYAEYLSGVWKTVLKPLV